MSQPSTWRENKSHGGHIQWVDGSQGPLPTCIAAGLGLFYYIICKTTYSNQLLCHEAGCNFPICWGFAPELITSPAYFFSLFLTVFYFSMTQLPFLFINTAYFSSFKVPLPPCSHLNPNVCSYCHYFPTSWHPSDQSNKTFRSSVAFFSHSMFLWLSASICTQLFVLLTGLIYVHIYLGFSPVQSLPSPTQSDELLLCFF